MFYKNGFTMIELVFVIIIVGVLAGIALPRLHQNTTQAKIAVVKNFTNTVNKEVFPNIWGSSIKKGNKGDITDFKIKNYMSQIPKIIGDINLSKCDDNKNYKTIKTITIDKEELKLQCKNGSQSEIPKFKISN